MRYALYHLPVSEGGIRHRVDDILWIECSDRQSYLMNISIPVASIHRLIPFQDFFNLNTCKAVKGRRGSVGAGGAGSVKPSAMSGTDSTSLWMVSLSRDWRQPIAVSIDPWATALSHQASTSWSITRLPVPAVHYTHYTTLHNRLQIASG